MFIVAMKLASNPENFLQASQESLLPSRMGYFRTPGSASHHAHPTGCHISQTGMSLAHPTEGPCKALPIREPMPSPDPI